jgi:hypothetical protein
MHSMELLGDVGHVEPRFDLFGDSVSIGARLIHSLHQMYHSFRNCFGCTRWNSYVMRLKWKLVSILLEIVLVSLQDRCTVCAKHTIAS